jgi:small-conductance mechanosensitive channel
MKRFWSELNPTLRGFLIIGLIALTVVVLNLYTALASLQALSRIAFALAIAFFVFLLWRERREEIGSWPARSRVAFFGGALVIVSTIGAFVLIGANGAAAAAGLVAIVVSAFAMFRVWRDQRSYGF